MFTNAETGESIAVSLKATDSPAYVEAALLRYPDVPIMTTDEVALHFLEDARIGSAGIANEEVTRVTEDNFDDLLARVSVLHGADMAAQGVTVAALVGLWPFVVAHLRGEIPYERLEYAFTHTLGEAGAALAARASWGVAFGPLFAWYLLARGVMGVTRAVERGAVEERRLEWRPGSTVAVAEPGGVPVNSRLDAKP